MRNAYELLNRPEDIQQEILQKQYELDGLRQGLMPGSMNYDSDRVKNSVKDRMPDYASRIDELENEITLLKRKKKAAINNIKKAVQHLPEKHKTVILGFYVANKTIKEIADDMGYSMQRVYQYKKEAIKILNRKK